MNDMEFSAIVVMILVTTLITPPILRGLFMNEAKQRAHAIHVHQVEKENKSEAS